MKKRGLNTKRSQILFLEVFIKFMMNLKATTIEIGLLLNFDRKPEFKRFVYDNRRRISA